MVDLRTAMTEQQLVDGIIELAGVLDWRVVHFRPAKTAHGWRTALQGDKGYPDLTLARDGRVVFAECKSAKGKATDDQIAWLDAVDPGWHHDRVLSEYSPEAYLWFPEDWTSGRIDDVLRCG